MNMHTCPKCQRRFDGDCVMMMENSLLCGDCYWDVMRQKADAAIETESGND